MVFMLEGNAIHHSQGCCPGAWAQSSHPTFLFFYDRQLREGLSNYLHLKHIPLPLYNLSYRDKNALVGTAGLDTVCACSSFTNQNLPLIKPITLEIEQRKCISVQISVGIVVSTSYQFNIRTSPLPEMIYKLRAKQQASSDNNQLIFI